MSTWIESPSGVDHDEELTPKQLVALFDWVGERALREAIANERVGSRPGRRANSRVLTLRTFLADARRLPPCSAPDCELPALAGNGGCGQRGHGRAGKRRSPTVGRAIAAAKKGRPQIELAPGEVTLAGLVKASKTWRSPHPQNGYSRETLRDALKEGRLTPKKTVERSSGRHRTVTIFDEGAAKAEIEQCECLYADCKAPAPGTSGVCRRHVATLQRGKPKSPEARANMALAARGRRGGKYVTCPGCGNSRYRLPSRTGVAWHFECWIESPEGRASLERAETAARTKREGELRRLREEGWVPMPDLAADLGVSRPVVTDNYIKGNLLAAERRGVRMVVSESEATRFKRQWALGALEGQGRRAAWLDEEKVLANLRARGLVERFAEGPITAADVEEALRKKVRARRRAILPYAGGKPPSPQVRERDRFWAGEVERILAELWEEYERDVDLELAPTRPTRWAAAGQLGFELDPENPERGRRRVWQALNRLKTPANPK